MADRGDRLPLIFMARIPGLATHLGWSFLRYQARRKSGVRAFRRELGSIRQLIAGRGASGS